MYIVSVLHFENIFRICHYFMYFLKYTRNKLSWKSINDVVPQNYIIMALNVTKTTQCNYQMKLLKIAK